MPSSLEAILLPLNQAICSILLDNLDHDSLLRLRRCSRICRDAVTTRSAQLFQNLYLQAPLRGNSALREIDIVGPNCRHLTIKVKLPGNSRPNSKVDAPIKNETNSLRETALERSRQSQSTSASSTDALADSGTLAMDQTLWSHAFAWCGRVTIITLRIDGDPVWPGRTSLEDMLVTIRMSLENSRMPQLRVLELQPTHAMGIIHLRWDPFGAWRAVQPSGAQVWRNLTTLKLTLYNPSDTPQLPEMRRIIPSQYLLFLKMLQAYLRSFSPTLRCLKFMWLGNPGPSPILLHREQGMANQQPLQWPRLEELWYGNITHQRETLMALSRLAPGISNIKAFRQGTQSAQCELKAWQDIHVSSAYTSYALDGGPDGLPVPTEVLERIETGSAAHAQNKITPTPSTYDRPLSAPLNKLSRRPIPRKRLQKFQHPSPPPTRPLPPIPNEDVVIAARTALSQQRPHITNAATTITPSAVPLSTRSGNAPQVPSPSNDSSETSPSTLPIQPELPISPGPELQTTTSTRIANWRKALALSTASFAETTPTTTPDSATISSERTTAPAPAIATATNTLGDAHDTATPRPDSEAWPVTRFHPPPGTQDPQRTPEEQRVWFVRDSRASLDGAESQSSWASESGSESEYSDEEGEEDGDRMSTVSARVEPLRFGARTMEGETAAVRAVRSRANATASSIYSEAGAYGAGIYRRARR